MPEAPDLGKTLNAAGLNMFCEISTLPLIHIVKLSLKEVVKYSEL